MVRHLRKPGHPRRRRLVSYRPPVRSITPRQPPGRSGSPPLLSTFFPLSPSPLLFCSIFSLLYLPRLLPPRLLQPPHPLLLPPHPFFLFPFILFSFFFKLHHYAPFLPSILPLPSTVFSFSLILFHPSSSTRLLRSTFLLHLLRFLFSPSPSRAASSFFSRPTESLCSPRRGSCFPPSSTPPPPFCCRRCCAFASFACQPSVQAEPETKNRDRPRRNQDGNGDTGERDVSLCPRVGSSRQASGSKGRGTSPPVYATDSERLRTYLPDTRSTQSIALSNTPYSLLHQDKSPRRATPEISKHGGYDDSRGG